MLAFFLNKLDAQSGTSYQINPSCAENSGSLGIDVTTSLHDFPFPYTFIIYNEEYDYEAEQVLSSNNAVFNNIPPGEYRIRILLDDVTELRLCGEIESSIVLDGVVKPSCTDDYSGSIDLTVSGGTSPYIYKWSNGSTNKDISELQIGMYFVTVTDANGCRSTNEFEVETSTVLTLDKIQSQVTNACSSTSTDGKIEISINDSNGPYTVTWYRLQKISMGSVPILYFLLKKSVIYSSNNGDEDLLNIGEGNYLVKISDGKCTDLALSFHVSGELYIETQDDIFICSENTGEITPTVIGGSLPISYLWSNGQTGQTALNLAAGTFTLTVTDNEQCTTKQSFIVKRSNIKFDLEKKNKVCDDGVLSYVSVKGLTGGKSPYSFLWNNGMASETIVNLSAGSYTVTVTDDAGCTKQATAQILNQNSGIQTPIIKNAQECVCDGSIQVKFYGTSFASGIWYKGNEIYREFKNGVDQSIYNLCPGMYRFYDENHGCPIDEIFYIEEEP